jgi:serine/threonine-protein phosphatase 2B regulatory subunit
VSYTEFYDLVTDPDPGRPDFGKHGVTDEKTEAKKNAGDQMKRQRELEKREEKRKMLATFVDENNVGVAEIQAAIEDSAAMPADQRKKGIDFGQFCKFNKVEPTGEYHRLFQLFDPFGKGTVDMKELALGMLNFVDNLSKEDKCDLVFRIFDEDSSGLLTADELTNVLAANHMQSVEAVSKKAETIMRQADRDGNGELSLDEFRIVTQKFPNILFPAFSKEVQGE